MQQSYDNKGNSQKSNAPNVFAYILAALIMIGIGFLIFLGIGAAVFLIPLLGGAFISRK